MENRTVPIVVTLSGKMELEVTDGMTMADVQELAAKNWNIDMNEVSQPFMVAADIVTGSHVLVDAKMEVSGNTKETELLRVVLPLRPKE